MSFISHTPKRVPCHRLNWLDSLPLTDFTAQHLICWKNEKFFFTKGIFVAILHKG